MLPISWKPRFVADLVRVGPKHDGGYVIAQSALDTSDRLVSMGLNDDWGFEAAFQARTGALIDCYDHSVSRGFWARHAASQLVDFVRGRGNFNNLFVYFKYRSFFGGPSARHHLKKIGYSGSGTVSLADILVGDRSRNVFIKVDIEGWEYRILDQIVDFRSRISGLAIELHDVDLHREKITDFIARLSPELELVYIHPNNAGGVDPAGDPLILELSFARLSEEERHPDGDANDSAGLGARNLPGKPDIELRFA